MLEFTIDGNLVDSPKGIEQLTHKIYFNKGLRGYLEQFDGSVTFYGGEYAYLRNRFFVDGCAISTVVIRNGEDTYTGNIFLNDAEWDVDECGVTCEIVDASFLSLIDNNKDIKAYLNVPRSKNDVDISAATVVQTTLSFGENEVGAGLNPTPANRSGVRVFDAFRFLIAFMSDGQIGFVSDFFNPETNPANATQPRNPTLITGQEARTGDGDEWPYISFQELYDDIGKLYNITFSMETVNGVPTMRIEPVAYFKSQSQTLTLSDARGVKQEADRESYYQLIKFGDSADVDEDGFYPPATFMSWTQEEYHLGGQCNTKATLDLQLKTLVINTNAIQSVLPTGTQNVVNPPSTDYDDDLFLVIFDGNNQTVLSVNPLDADKRYYNARLTNSEVANRWGDGVPFPIYLFLGQSNNFANGMLTSTNFNYGGLPVQLVIMGETLFGQVPLIAALNCNDDTFPNGADPNGLYTIQNATPVTSNPGPFPSPSPQTASRYTAPFNAVYTVRFTGVIKAVITHTGQQGGYGVSFQVFSSANVFRSEIYFPASLQPSAPLFGVGANEWDVSANFFLLSGDYVIVTVFDPWNYTSNSSASQETELYVFRGARFIIEDPLGGEWKTYNPADNWLFKTMCRYPITCEWWRSFRNNWHQLILLTYGSGQSSGYVNEVNRNILTGDADVDIVSKFADVTR
jgi:hypothetical protein